ncbi:myrosinase 1-like [Schistocerca serialis cubense]|uniref:myrosinase 1-like n=1 Tax=Schistocerca serialis cubense TaxID=2023355 RepID=UPI00214EF155|nr:myrosinase 1-like [Schistocerca serialis cubense]
MWTLVIALSAVLATGWAQSATYRFPDGFFLGASTSAYQVEGAWNEDGKGESIQDNFFHNHPEYTSGDTGDVACDSYHKYKEDVQMLKEINADVYRFSISWPRILPTGDLDVINQAGIDYYNNLINELLANGIQPLVTIYHWDMPQSLQYLGGWPNELIVDYFVEHARILFENFGDRVKWWTTFNEPAVFLRGYASANIAPGQNASGIGDYLATHAMLKAHARVWHLYDEQYRATQNGSVGITFSFGLEPLTNSTEDAEAAERARQFDIDSSGFRRSLNWIANEYPGYPVIITENGLKDFGGRNDVTRINYFADFLGALLEAVNLDGVPVIGYTLWSLMDVLEWDSGFTAKFGVYEVDFSSPNRTRTPKDSAAFIAEVYGSRQLPEQYRL